MMNFWQYTNKNNFVICFLAFYVGEVKLSGLHGFLDRMTVLIFWSKLQLNYLKSHHVVKSESLSRLV